MSYTGLPGKISDRRKKENIPIEILNAREWDPNYRKEDHPSDDESDNGDYFDPDEDYDYEYHIPYTSGGPETNVAAANTSSNTPSNNDGFQQVSYKHSSKQASIAHGSGPNNRKTYRQQARPKPIFRYKKDNLAKAAFRKKQPPNCKYTLPKFCHDIEPNRARMYSLIENIGERLGSFVQPPQHDLDRELLIWGNATQGQKTIAALQSVFGSQDMTRKSFAKENFVSEPSTVGPKYKAKQSQLEKEVMIQKFQQVPEASHDYPYTGSFLWPVDEVRPEELFGSSFEAFDPLRFQYKCHIVFENKLSIFKVLTNDSESVTKVLQRIEGTMKEFIAKNYHRRSVEYLVEPPNRSAIREDVKNLPGPSLSKIPTLAGKPLDLKAGNDYIQSSKEMRFNNNIRLERALLKTISNLPHYRGQLQARIYFGTFALSQFRWPENARSIPFQQFMDNMSLSNTKGGIRKDLQIEKNAVSVLNKVYEAQDLFLPLSNYIENLVEVTPSIAAHFEFQEYNQPTMLLDVELNAASLREAHERTQALWTRADRRDNATLLDVFIIQVDGGSSCKLHVSNEHTIDETRITSKMKDFVSSVKVKIPPKIKPELTGHKVVQWGKDFPGTMCPTSFEQKVSFRYRLVRNSDWIFEIARYDSFDNTKDDKIPVDTHWAATMLNTEWDSILLTNAGLGIGQSATWDPKLGTFFPSPTHSASHDQGIDPGLLEFVETLRMITGFLDGLKKEDPDIQE